MSKTKTAKSRINSKKSNRAIELNKENWDEVLRCAQGLNKTPDFVVNTVLSRLDLIPVASTAEVKNS